MNARQTSATLTALLLAASSTAYAQEDPPPPPPTESTEGAADEEPAGLSDPRATPPSTDEPTRDTRELKEFYLTDGQVLVGYGTEKGDVVEVELENGALVTLPLSSIKTIRARKAPRGPRTTHRTRYLYSPSGMMLEQGEGYISQKELLFTSFAYGLTDNFSIIVGGAVPLWFIDPQFTFNIIGGFKVGGEVADDVHLSAGAEALFIPGVGGFGGLAFGNLTLGDAEGHFTVNVAAPFISEIGFTTQIITTTISGYHQFTDGFGLVTENWVTFQPTDPTSGAVVFNSLAGRFLTGDFTIDAGLVVSSFVSPFGVQFAPFPLPWVDFSWGFGP